MTFELGKSGVRVSFILLFFGLIVLIYAKGWHTLLTLEEMGKNYIQLKDFIRTHLLLSLIIYSAFYILIVVFCLPLTLVATVSGGLFFGWKMGAPAAIFSASFGAVLLFEITKTSLGSLVLESVAPWLQKLREGFNKDALNYLLFLRLVPLFPFFVVNLAPAFLNVSLKTFVLGTFFGIIPATFAYSYAGSSLAHVVEVQSAAYALCVSRQSTERGLECPFVLDITGLVTPEVLLATVLLGCVALLPVVLKKWNKRF